MPTIAKKFHPVYTEKGRLIPVPELKKPTLSKAPERIGYPFHILKTTKDSFVVKDLSLEKSLRTQASKQTGASETHRFVVSSVEGVGLVVKKVKRS